MSEMGAGARRETRTAAVQCFIPGGAHLDALKKAFSIIGRFDIANYGERLASLQKAEREYESATQDPLQGCRYPAFCWTNVGSSSGPERNISARWKNSTPIRADAFETRANLIRCAAVSKLQTSVPMPWWCWIQLVR